MFFVHEHTAFFFNKPYAAKVPVNLGRTATTRTVEEHLIYTRPLLSLSGRSQLVDVAVSFQHGFTTFSYLAKALMPTHTYCRTHARLLPYACTPTAVHMHANCRAQCRGRQRDGITPERGLEYCRNVR